MLTAGIDLAAQDANTGLVLIDWSVRPPALISAGSKIGDRRILEVWTDVAASGGRVGIDCPLGWPRPFREFVNAHAVGGPLPSTGPGTMALRQRATDIALHQRLRVTPLSVSTDRLGVPALRAARLTAVMAESGEPVDRAGRGTVCEVYPRASRMVWNLPARTRDLADVLGPVPLTLGGAERAQFDNEHVFDALIAALTARAVALGATEPPPADLADLAAEEGWMHVPVDGHRLADLTAHRSPPPEQSRR